MEHVLTRLPGGFREIYSIDLQRDKKTALLINGAAVLIMAVMLVGMHFIVPWWTALGELPADGELDFTPLLIRLAVLLAGYVVYIILHELTHAAVMKHYGAGKVRFGYTGLYAFAGSEEDYFDRYSYFRVAMAPLIVWGVIFLILQFVVPLSWFWVVWLWQIGNVSGAVGDVFVTIRFSRMPRDILVRDTGVSIAVYSGE